MIHQWIWRFSKPLMRQTLLGAHPAVPSFSILFGASGQVVLNHPGSAGLWRMSRGPGAPRWVVVDILYPSANMASWN